MVAVLFMALCQIPDDERVIDPPPVAAHDLRFFPPLAVVQENLLLANDHMEWLLLMRSCDPSRREEWGIWLHAAERSKRPWLNLEFALLADQKGDSGKRDKYLIFLRSRLGCRRYYAGVLPPPVPIHLFQHYP